jgi:hypothetical protein
MKPKSAPGFFLLGAFALAAVLAVSAAPASAFLSPSRIQTPAEKPVLQAVRVADGPVVDGRLDDPVWGQAAPFAGFKQIFPEPGAAPSERTELRILFDASRLYIGLDCRDSAPKLVCAFTMAHDVVGEDDDHDANDHVRILLDPFQDMRNAYLFIVNACGARSEGLAFGEHSSLNWDGIWNARCEPGSGGWTAEIEIPFKTISFKPGLDAWGINVERYIPRKQETIRLTGIRRDAFFNNASEAAPLRGIGGVRQGLGITFRPYATGGALKPPETGPGTATAAKTDWNLDGGFDLYKNFTPNFVGAVSVNTDFAETEVDERRLNLTRFSLYFPEKRTFFLEGSEIFNFAGLTGAYEPSFMPFFSRRIGLFEGERVPISFGAKVFGKLGDTNIAILDVGTRGSTTAAGVGLSRKNFVAGRVYQNIWAESKVGLIFTDGSPDGSRNTLAGIDFIYQTSRFRGDQNFSATGWFVANWNETAGGRHQGFGLRLDYPNDLWDINSSYAYYGDALDPGLGFLPRPGVQTYSLGFNFMPRPEKGLVGRLVRQFFYELRFNFYWDLRGNLETRRIFAAPLNFRTESGEHFEFNVIPNRDVLPFAFEISDGVVLPSGPYDFTNYGLMFNSASHRPWTVDLEYSFGPFYSGRYDNVEAAFALRYKGYAALEIGAEIVRADLPQGRFAENVYQLKADVFLSPDLGLMNYFQYDDVSKNLGLNIRFRWRVSPGNEIYFVYTKNWERRWDPAARFYPMGERGVFKIQLSFRP